MSDGKKCKVHTAEFKAKVGQEAVQGVKTIGATRSHTALIR